MTATRYRNACIWLTIAALAIASLARLQAGVEHARTYTAPVLEFLAAQQAAAGSPAAHEFHPGAGHQTRHRRLAFLHDSGSTAWAPMLPVLFIGLIVPLCILSAPSSLRAGIPSTPLLPASFQRPPPASIG